MLLRLTVRQLVSLNHKHGEAKWCSLQSLVAKDLSIGRLIYLGENNWLRFVKYPILSASCAFTCTSSRRKCKCSVAKKPDLGLGHLIVDVSGSHTIRYTHTIWLHWTNDYLVGAAATYTTHTHTHTHTNDQHPSPFETAIPAIRRLQTYALERPASGIGRSKHAV
jgi:hypothetical protein